MYKLAIIDDEHEHVKGVRDYIPWERYEIEVCGIAYNGREGLKLIKECRPEIALVDIQMPFIDGLSLIEEVNTLDINTQMIIMSGHDDFEYARQAIKLKASNYLLKPCSAEEILQAVLKAKNTYLEESNKKCLLEQYQSVFPQYINLLKERFLISLLDNNLQNPSSFFKDISSYGIDLSDSPCCTAVFRLEDKDKLYTQSTNKEFDFLIISIIEEIKKVCTDKYPFELVIKGNDIVFISSGEFADYDTFVSLIRKIYNRLSEVFEYQFTVGIGQVVSSPLFIHKSYSQALAVLENSIFLGEKKVVIYDDRILEESFHYLYPFNEEKKLLHAIEAGDSSSIREEVNNFFVTFEQCTNIDNNILKKIGITLLNSMMRFCSEKNIYNDALHQLIFSSFDEIINAVSFESMKAEINKTIDKIIEHIHNTAPINKLVQLALNYIHGNYAREISLKTVADELFISASYLSFLFKQELKKNFVDYLNNYRINIAKDLFKDPRLKSYEIAYQVGFQDEKYFYKLFKKYTGLTPSQYRESVNIY